MLTRSKVEDTNMAIDIAMSNLRDSMKKVPDKGLGLNAAHTRFASSVAVLSVLLDEAARFTPDGEDLFDLL
ncbi:hypothetical protein [Glycomyces paridis]|uniref:Uncharacterized protein n=1 Tax=Glycomyces paridis TaxID=2126555 RepID=A0A4S8PHG2_9ACTN|nr:hypothetical protein [Glycomyces paridis]THV30043.1 hypothetical protein E9998_06595 [Glycomyces paridis]